MDDERVTTDSCAQCKAPLADDQRYCLQCGEPRPHVSRPPSAKSALEKPPLSPPGFVAPEHLARNNSVALMPGGGVLLLAMGVGVLIGRAGAGSAKPAPAQ